MALLAFIIILKVELPSVSRAKMKRVLYHAATLNFVLLPPVRYNVYTIEESFSAQLGGCPF